MEFAELTEKVIAAALKVHSAIGPGVLEKVYRACLQHEIRKAGLGVASEVMLPILYDGIRLESGCRIDLLVEGLLIVELKCVESIEPIHKAQLLTYLRLANKPRRPSFELQRRSSTRRDQTSLEQQVSTNFHGRGHSVKRVS